MLRGHIAFHRPGGRQLLESVPGEAMRTFPPAKLALVVMAFALSCITAHAQSAAPTAVARAFPLAPPPGPQIAPTPLTDSNDGFVPIFNGISLDGWDGDPRYWRVENHEIVGEVTAEAPLKQNSFLIWRGGRPANFELKAEFRLNPLGNSGINYRSDEVPGTKWLMSGYQADIDGPNRYTGQNYEERARTFLAPRGTIAYVATRQNPAHTAPLCLQLHVGPPMKVEYRTVLLKTLP